MTESPTKPRLFEAIAQSLRDAIQQGVHPVGDHLPSIQQLAAKYGASHMTVKNALAVLESEGVLALHAGVPARVVASPKSARPIQAQLDELRTAVDQLTERLNTLESHVR
ncbi:winged helix-turn-helix domain-containing protein [Kribbella sp. NPDC003505]|uniref:winged helix-turn-helix domain-containing protein n=1 Tax=Kribbella sp. NPDC003505 TaxID=3154448 RepID=UPI0033BE59FD